MINLKTIGILGILAIASLSAYGQTKYEKEYNLKLQQVPTKARQFVDSMKIEKKVKWYYEENLKGNSIEAKVKFNNRKYSIEFDTIGNLQDMEISIPWSEIGEEVKKNICTELKARYDYHKINKMQIQYAGKRTALLALGRDDKTDEPYRTRFEAVVKGKKGKQVNLYEITFNEEGKFIEAEQIIFRNSDNLEY